MTAVSKRGAGLYIFPRGINTLGRLPFFIKLPICLFIDLIGFAVFFARIGAWLSGIGIPIGELSNLAYAVTQALIGVLLFNNWALVVPITLIEAAPGLNALPTLTIFSLWNGYKTKWKY